MQRVGSGTYHSPTRQLVPSHTVRQPSGDQPACMTSGIRGISFQERCSQTKRKCAVAADLPRPPRSPRSEHCRSRHASCDHKRPWAVGGGDPSKDEAQNPTAQGQQRHGSNQNVPAQRFARSAQTLRRPIWSQADSPSGVRRPRSSNSNRKPSAADRPPFTPSRATPVPTPP